MQRLVLSLFVTGLAVGVLVSAASAQYPASLIGHAGAIGSGEPCQQLQGWVCDTADPDIDVPAGSSTSVYVMVAGLGIPLQFSRAEFGIIYDPAKLRIDSWTGCGDTHVPSQGWPSTGTRILEVFSTQQTANRVAIIGMFRVTVLGQYAWLELSGNSTADNIPLWEPSLVSFNGEGGFNVCESVGTESGSWGRVKGLYR